MGDCTCLEVDKVDYSRRYVKMRYSICGYGWMSLQQTKIDSKIYQKGSGLQFIGNLGKYSFLL